MIRVDASHLDREKLNRQPVSAMSPAASSKLARVPPATLASFRTRKVSCVIVNRVTLQS